MATLRTDFHHCVSAVMEKKIHKGVAWTEFTFKNASGAEFVLVLFSDTEPVSLEILE